MYSFLAWSFIMIICTFPVCILPSGAENCRQTDRKRAVFESWKAKLLNVVRKTRMLATKNPASETFAEIYFQFTRPGASRIVCLTMILLLESMPLIVRIGYRSSVRLLVDRTYALHGWNIKQDIGSCYQLFTATPTAMRAAVHGGADIASVPIKNLRKYTFLHFKHTWCADNYQLKVTRDRRDLKIA